MISRNLRSFINTRSSILLLIAISLTFILPQDLVSAGNFNEVIFEMRSESNIVLITETNKTDFDAANTRFEIDSDHGNSNGIVEASEVEGYKNSLKDQTKGLTITQNTYYDGIALDIMSTTVKVTNAEGLANSTAPLQIIYTSELDPLEDPGKPEWHSVAFKGEYYRNKTLKIIAPEGWRISQNPKNFQVSVRSADSREVSGVAIGTFDVEIKMYNPSRFDDGSGDSGTIDIFGTGNIIYLLLPLILVVIIIIVLLLRRKKPEKETAVNQEGMDDLDGAKDSTEEVKKASNLDDPKRSTNGK